MRFTDGWTVQTFKKVFINTKLVSSRMTPTAYFCVIGLKQNKRLSSLATQKATVMKIHQEYFSQAGYFSSSHGFLKLKCDQ